MASSLPSARVVESQVGGGHVDLYDIVAVVVSEEQRGAARVGGVLAKFEKVIIIQILLA